MTTHEGFLGRGRTNSLRRRMWVPQCSCGWRHDGYYQRPAAQRAVDRHLAEMSSRFEGDIDDVYVTRRP